MSIPCVCVMRIVGVLLLSALLMVCFWLCLMGYARFESARKKTAQTAVVHHSTTATTSFGCACVFVYVLEPASDAKILLSIAPVSYSHHARPPSQKTAGHRIRVVYPGTILWNAPFALILIYYILYDAMRIEWAAAETGPRHVHTAHIFCDKDEASVWRHPSIHTC